MSSPVVRCSVEIICFEIVIASFKDKKRKKEDILDAVFRILLTPSFLSLLYSHSNSHDNLFQCHKVKSKNAYIINKINK